MAAPTPVTNTWQVGHAGWTTLYATWASTDNFPDTIMVDLSGLTTYTTKLFVRSVKIDASPGISVVVEIDSTTDELVLQCPIGALHAEENFARLGGYQGLPKQTAGATGDIVLTTTSAASGDEISVTVEWYAV